MAGKKGKSEGEKKLQKQRTYRNQGARYRTLLERFPDHKDRDLWEKKREFFEKAIT